MQQHSKAYHLSRLIRSIAILVPARCADHYGPGMSSQPHSGWVSACRPVCDASPNPHLAAAILVVAHLGSTLARVVAYFPNLKADPILVQP